MTRQSFLTCFNMKTNQLLLLASYYKIQTSWYTKIGLNEKNGLLFCKEVQNICSSFQVLFMTILIGSSYMLYGAQHKFSDIVQIIFHSVLKVLSNKKWNMGQIYVAFSEYLNFYNLVDLFLTDLTSYFIVFLLHHIFWVVSLLLSASSWTKFALVFVIYICQKIMKGDLEIKLISNSKTAGQSPKRPR